MGLALAASLFAWLAPIADNSYVRGQDAITSEQVAGPRSNLPWIEKWLSDNIEPLVSDYWWLHQNPEVSFEEAETAAYLADAWQRAGFEVTKMLVDMESWLS